jgi:predicted deacylase
MRRKLRESRPKSRWLLPLLAWVVVGSLSSSPFATRGADDKTASHTHAAITNSLADGTRFETEYYFHNSGSPGPTLMIVGGMHGNEPAGAAAAEVIRHWQIAKGKLLVIPRANVPALNAKKRLIPGVATNVSNLNRNFPRANQEESPRGELAAAIWELALEYKPDWLLDLHEGYDFSRTNSKSVGSSLIAFPMPEADAAAKLMLDAVNATIPDASLNFMRLGTPVNGSLARAAGEHLKIPAMILETTTKQPLAKRALQHQVMVAQLMDHLEMLQSPPETVRTLQPQIGREPPQRPE